MGNPIDYLRDTNGRNMLNDKGGPMGLMDDYMMTGNTRTLAQAHSPGASADSSVVIQDSTNPNASMVIPNPAPVLPGFADIG